MSILRVPWWQQRLYKNPQAWDPVRRFVTILEEFVRPEHEVLDLGAGAGQLSRYALRGRVKRIVGADLDDRVLQNPLLDQGVKADLLHLPFPDASFDLAFSIYVLEHIADPAGFVREVARVLRPGGVFLCLTPNRHHYVALASALTPASFHRMYNRWRGTDAEDTFPTHYRMNTPDALNRLFAAGGFEPARMAAIESQPNYLKFCVPMFLLGVLYERLVNSTDRLQGLRVNLICAFRKRPDAEAG